MKLKASRFFSQSVPQTKPRIDTYRVIFIRVLAFTGGLEWVGIKIYLNVIAYSVEIAKTPLINIVLPTYDFTSSVVCAGKSNISVQLNFI